MDSEEQIQINFLKATRVSEKVMKLLQRRTKSFGEAYLACKILTLYFENTVGITMDPSEENALTEFVKNNKGELKDV